MSEGTVAFCRAKGSARGWRGGAGHDDQDRGQDDEGPGSQSVPSRMKGEVAQVKDDKPKKPAAKSMMEMLRETAESSK